jgi:hypothetical protein
MTLSDSFVCSISAQSTGDLFQNHIRKHATASASEPLLHQFQKQVFSLLADRRYVLQIDDEFTAAKSRSGLFAGGFQFIGPRRDEPALYHQPALIPSFDNGDLQHAAFPLACEPSTSFLAPLQFKLTSLPHCWGTRLPFRADRAAPIALSL